MPSELYSFEVTTIDGKILKLSEYSARPMLIVNVASKCGFTPQYTGLQKLYEEYGKSGFVVLGFPCDQFGHQEPGSEEEIREFCDTHYHITFPMFAKIDVNGPDEHPLFRYLKKTKKGIFGIKRIQWNFTKFLVAPDGKVLKRFAPVTPPYAIRPFIDRILS
jgi:glutathione peroxidase